MTVKTKHVNSTWIDAIGSPYCFARANSRGFDSVSDMSIADTPCPDCGYSLMDALYLGDHRICSNQNPPWKDLMKKYSKQL